MFKPQPQMSDAGLRVTSRTYDMRLAYLSKGRRQPWTGEVEGYLSLCGAVLRRPQVSRLDTPSPGLTQGIPSVILSAPCPWFGGDHPEVCVI